MHPVPPHVGIVGLSADARCRKYLGGVLLHQISLPGGSYLKRVRSYVMSSNPSDGVLKYGLSTHQ